MGQSAPTFRWPEAASGAFTRALEQRHKLVRGLLGLDNDGSEYESIRGVIERLISLRDSFAHPKEHVETVEGAVTSEFEPMPEIAWQREVRAEVVPDEFLQVEAYCEKLLNSASEALMRTTTGAGIYGSRNTRISNM